MDKGEHERKIIITLHNGGYSFDIRVVFHSVVIGVGIGLSCDYCAWMLIDTPMSVDRGMLPHGNVIVNYKFYIFRFFFKSPSEPVGFNYYIKNFGS